MPNHEQSEGQPTPIEPPQPEKGYAIMVTPDKEEGVVFDKLPDGRPTMTFRGEISIFPTKESLPERLLKAGTGVSSTNTLESDSEPLSGPHSAQEKISNDASPKEQPDHAENENKKFEIVGNVVYEPSYKVRRSGKKIADFALATHPDDETTEYWRIRAFDDVAERVRDQVRKGQKDVAATVYGTKHWEGRKKTKDGWEETTITGYYAGFVKVPRKYREEQAQGQQQKQQQEEE